MFLNKLLVTLVLVVAAPSYAGPPLRERTPLLTRVMHRARQEAREEIARRESARAGASSAITRPSRDRSTNQDLRFRMITRNHNEDWANACLEYSRRELSDNTSLHVGMQHRLQGTRRRLMSVARTDLRARRRARTLLRRYFGADDGVREFLDETAGSNSIPFNRGRTRATRNLPVSRQLVRVRQDLDGRDELVQTSFGTTEERRALVSQVPPTRAGGNLLPLGPMVESEEDVPAVPQQLSLESVATTVMLSASVSGSYSQNSQDLSGIDSQGSERESQICLVDTSSYSPLN